MSLLMLSLRSDTFGWNVRISIIAAWICLASALMASVPSEAPWPWAAGATARARAASRESEGTETSCAVEADASGSVEREEVERFVLDDAPEAGENEFAVVLEALREAARKTFDPSDTMNPVAQAFRSVARLTERPFKGDSPHSLPTHV